MSQLGKGGRRRSWQARAQRARRRFIQYRCVQQDIDDARNRGATPPAMIWRVPLSDIHALIAEGIAASQALGQKRRWGVAYDAIVRLEHVVDRLAAADDWTRRLQPFCQELRTERARLALTKLVNLGCVPHDLVRRIGIFTDAREGGAIEEKRRETAVYLPRLQALAKLFIQLATACDRYMQLPTRYGGSTFRLDRHAVAFLRAEAAEMRQFLHDADTRRRLPFTRARHHLNDMAKDIKIITGTFQDALVAEVLNGVPGLCVTADQLRKIRTRLANEGKRWKPPTYVTRPTSRIAMETPTTER